MTAAATASATAARVRASAARELIAAGGEEAVSAGREGARGFGPSGGLAAGACAPPLAPARLALFSAAPTSSAVCHRSAGFLARHFATIFATAGGTSGASVRSAGGGAVRIAAITVDGASPTKGGRP